MSYAIRNTLILLTTILIMGVSGWAYLRYYYEDPVIEQEKEIVEKQALVVDYTEKAANYSQVESDLNNVRFLYENHTKLFYPNNSVAIMFDYLRSINRGEAATSMNFTLIDSVLNPQYGIIRVKLAGGGTYDAFYNFLSILEQSKPMSKITELRMNSQTDNANNYFVTYDATLHFFFNRATSILNPDLTFTTDTPKAIHNPFSPLVKSEPSRTTSESPIVDTPVAAPNSEGLVEVNRSSLVGLVRSGAYIQDQQGQIVYLPIGGRVYQGTLTDISLVSKTATFRVVRGSQTEVLTLQIREN